MSFSNMSSKDLMRKSNALAVVDGRPTHELADQKYDIDAMLQCCDAEDINYWGQQEGARLCAAPFYFERAAILLRRNKDYLGEIAICMRWKAITDDYKGQSIVKAKHAVLTHKGPHSIAILSRPAKAKELLRKQNASAKSGG